MKPMTWIAVSMVNLAVSASGALAMEGGELGNAFVPFDSKIGHYRLEYAKDWRLNDLSQATSFAESKPASAAGSFLEIVVDGSGPQSLAELAITQMTAHPGVAWASTSLGGLGGIEGREKGVRMIYLLRAPGDELALRLRSTDGPVSDEILAHMLASFRSE